jgi:hypothetical protein
MRWRYERMVKYVNTQFKYKVKAYSPIVHNHPIAVLGGLPRTWDFWKTFDIDMLRHAEELHVVCLPGWKKSRGVRAEIREAKRLDIAL